MFLLRVNYLLHDYGPIDYLLKFNSLVDRRVTEGLKLLDGLICNKVDSPCLLPLINFRVLRKHLRSLHAPFFTPIYTNNYLCDEPMR